MDLDVFDGLERLVEHALLRQSDDAEGEPRFTMLETIREYGLEQLGASGEAEEAHGRHAAFFLALAEDAEPTLKGGPEQGVWLERLETEHDNLRAALGWSLEQGDAESAQRLGAALVWFWWPTGHLTEGRLWLERALDLPGTVSTPIRVRALNGASVLTWMQGDLGVADDRAGEALTLARQSADTSGAAYALLSLGAGAGMRGATDTSGDLGTEALGLFRELGDRWGEAASLNNLGIVASRRGDGEQLTSLWEQSLRLSRQIGDKVSTSMLASNLGGLAAERGDHEQAAALLEEALALSHELDIPRNRVQVLLNLSYLAHLQHQDRRALTHAREALLLCRDMGAKTELVDSLGQVADAAAALGHDAQAARLVGAAARWTEALGLDSGWVEDARKELDASQLATAFTAGRELSLEEAVTEALAMADEITGTREVER